MPVKLWYNFPHYAESIPNPPYSQRDEYGSTMDHRAIVALQAAITAAFEASFTASPEIYTISTAAYAAVAAKIASLFALVVKLNPSANRTMKPRTMPSRAALSCTKYSASIEPMSKVAAMSVLQALTIHVKEHSSK